MSGRTERPAVGRLAGLSLAGCCLLGGLAGTPAAAQGGSQTGLSIHFRPDDSQPNIPLAIGTESPDFRLGALRGPRVVLSQLRGKVVLLDFWATGSRGGVAALPLLKELARRAASEPFALVSLNNERDLRKVEDFIAAHGMDWPQCWDDEHRVVSRLYEVKDFPTYVLIDPQGKVLFTQVGWSPGSGKTLRARVAQAILDAQKPAPAAAPAAPPSPLP